LHRPPCPPYRSTTRPASGPRRTLKTSPMSNWSSPFAPTSSPCSTWPGTSLRNLRIMNQSLLTPAAERRSALKHLKEGSSIINTTSVQNAKGNPVMLDYSSTKGAITTFTYSLSQNLVKRGIRVNAVAPGPIWTPLIPASMPEDKVKDFGKVRASSLSPFIQSCSSQRFPHRKRRWAVLGSPTKLRPRMSSWPRMSIPPTSPAR
jgi:short-subunit dehydrogenase